MDTNLIGQYGPALLAGFGVTILCWLFGTVFGMALGLLIALVQRYGPRWVGWIIQIYIEVIRGTPFLVQLFVLYYGGPLIGLRLDALPAGLLGLTIYGSPYFAEIFRSGFRAVPPGQLEATRAIGMAELALQLLLERCQERRVFGRYLAQYANIGDWIGESRLDIEQARLLVLKTAWMLDTVGARAARREIAMIKAQVPRMLCRVVDRAMQVFGAMGLSPDTPLADFYTQGRALRFADGPDEVHLRSLARWGLEASARQRGQTAAYLTPPG